MLSLLERYPGRVPVVMVRHSSCRPALRLDKERYIVPAHLTFGQYAYILRKRLKLNSAEALFFFTHDHTLVNPSMTVGELHTRYHGDAGHLTVLYTGENCFGTPYHFSRVKKF